MRPNLTTSYAQGISLWRWPRSAWYGCLVLLLLTLPLILDEFYIGELGGVFIFAIAGVGLMLLTGYTGLVSLGQSAFFGIGAYTNAVLLTKGVPFAVTLPLAGFVAGLSGIAIGLPTLRMSGFYLAIATLAFSSIVSTIFQKWTAVTNGFDGFAVPAPNLFGYSLVDANGLYFLSLAVLIFVIVIANNILRTPVGRAMVAIRDSEISAQSMGINTAIYKTVAFAVSAGMTGLAGALFAHNVRFMAPDTFDFVLSIQFVTIIFVGGIGSLHGAILGAIFVRLMPQFIAVVRDDLPYNLGRMPGLEPSLFGLILVGVIIFEPTGLYGRWLKLKTYVQEFPLHRSIRARKRRTYARSER